MELVSRNGAWKLMRLVKNQRLVGSRSLITTQLVVSVATDTYESVRFTTSAGNGQPIEITVEPPYFEGQVLDLFFDNYYGTGDNQPLTIQQVGNIVIYSNAGFTDEARYPVQVVPLPSGPVRNWGGTYVSFRLKVIDNAWRWMGRVL
jgi:hypothetical protein